MAGLEVAAQPAKHVSSFPRSVRSSYPRAVAVFPVGRTGDAQLVHAVTRGDQAAMTEVWDRYSGFVRGVLHGALGRDAVVDDLVQDVFVAFVRGAKTVTDGSKLRGFLAGIAVRLAAMEIRRRRVRSWLTLSPTGDLPETMAPERDNDGREVLSALDRVLSEMGHRRRMAFVLRRVQKLEMTEAAAALDLSESTLRRELTRAEQQLQRGAAREPALADYLARRRGELDD